MPKAETQKVTETPKPNLTETGTLTHEEVNSLTAVLEPVVEGPVEFKIRRTNSLAKIPTRGTEDAACWDVYACITHEDMREANIQGIASEPRVIIPGRGHKVINTGLHLWFPAGYEVQVKARSGLAAKNGITVLGGVIDADYRNQELKIILGNAHSDKDFVIKNGDRIAQIQLTKLTPTAVVEYFEDAPALSSRTGGLGSTGV